MNKESIYRIIGYNGEYNANVKKAIRKLLKENHPDNNGDRKVFELINEVKKELEENKVSFDYKNNKSSIKKNEDIDYLFCAKMIDKITNEKNMYIKKLDEKKKELADCMEKYKESYQDSIDMETYLLSNSSYKEKLKKIKYISILLIVFAAILFFISIWEKSIIFFAFFIGIVIICVVVINKAFSTIQELTENNRKKIKSYVGTNTNLRNSQTMQENIKQEINEINKKMTNLDNDLRFYNNLINDRG